VEEAKKIIGGADPVLLARAVHYLFTKETKSSFAIEGEVPSTDRTLRFVAALGSSGQLRHQRQTGLCGAARNSIVDARYAQKDWRTVQKLRRPNRVQFHRNCSLHLSQAGRCPRPYRWLDAHGLSYRRWRGRSDLRAAVTGFGFVFIHPFEDGTAEIHRFLIHHSLAKLKFAPQGILFPVSAAMLRDPKEYDAALNAFSSRIMPRIEYEMDDQQRLTVFE